MKMNIGIVKTNLISQFTLTISMKILITKYFSLIVLQEFYDPCGKNLLKLI